MTTTFLLVVFDGLRPDMVTLANTPNLLRFAAMGTRFTAWMVVNLLFT